MTGRFVVVLVVPDPLAKDIGRWRHRYATFSRTSLPPHVTLVPPFFGNLTRRDVIRLSNVASGETVTVGGWRWFHSPDRSVLWLEPTQEPFRRLVTRIQERMPKRCRVTYSDHFHVTVLNRVPPEALAKVKSAIAPVDLEATLPLGQPAVFAWHGRRRHWEPIDTTEEDPDPASRIAHELQAAKKKEIPPEEPKELSTEGDKIELFG